MVPHVFFHFPDTRFMLEVPNGVVGLHIEPNMHGMSQDAVQVTLFRQRVAIIIIGAVVAVVVVILLLLLLLVLLLLLLLLFPSLLRLPLPLLPFPS